MCVVVGERTNLGFSDPIVNVIQGASAAEIDVLAWSDEEGGGGHDVDDGWVARVVPCEPSGDGYVVDGSPERDLYETVYAEKELRAAIVVCCARDQT